MMSLETVRRNIENNGYHICTVLQGVCPRFSYSIGLHQKLGYELVVAGLCSVDAIHIPDLISSAIDGKHYLNQEEDSNHLIELKDANPSWASVLARWAVSYYQKDDIKLKQIIPEGIFTIDTPDMSSSYKNVANGSWRYLVEPWPYPISAESEAYCDSGIIAGQDILSISRYEEGYWEISSGFGYNDRAKILPASVIIERFGAGNAMITMDLDTSISFLS